MANDKTENKTETKPEPRKNLTFAEVKEIHDAQAGEVWAAICKIGGWGLVPTNNDGGISFAGLSTTERAEIEALLKKEGK